MSDPPDSRDSANSPNSIERELARLRARAPDPRPGLTDAVMQQVALRPKPRRSWWATFTQSRTLVVRFRWSRVTALAGVAAAAVVAASVGLDKRPQTANPTGQTASAPAPVPVDDRAEPRPVLVRFALPARAAQAVSLAGDFNGWRADATPLERNADGTWTATVALPPGTWSYSFVVDGKWVEDPLADSYRADGFGGRNALVRVGG